LIRREERSLRPRRIAILPWGDRFEDFYDRIGITSRDFQESFTGTWLFNLAGAMREAGLEPVVYFISARIARPERSTHRPTGTSLRFLPAPWLHRKLQGIRDRLRFEAAVSNSILSYAATPWPSLIRELRADGCGAILCQEYEFPRFDQAVVVGAILRMPVFATFQGADQPGSIVERPIRRFTVPRAAGLIAGAREEVARVRRIYGVRPDAIAEIPNPVDVDRWRPLDRQAARESLGIPAGSMVVVWHGRVEMHNKGLDVLLDAWELIQAPRRSPPPFLLLVGSGRDDELLRHRLAKVPITAVRWEERFVMDHERLLLSLSAADIAARPSRREGFSVSLIEAMACGLPIVASRVSGVAEALGEDHVGLMVPPGDADALARQLQRLLDDEALRDRLGRSARRRAEEEFSFDAVGRRLRAFVEARGAFGSASGGDPLGRS
jgi:glycosyltransferase involved in cell wall biosynthesis